MVLASSERASGQWIPGFLQEGEGDQPPSVSEILGLFRESQQYYSAFHKQCSLEEDYYLGRRTVPAPEGIDAVWPATAGAIVNVGTDHVDVNNIQIDVPAGPRAKARAERIKRFYQGVWSSIREPVLRTSVRQSFLYGISWMKVMFDSDRWPDAPMIDQFESDAEYKDALASFMEDRDLSFPFVVSVVNPKNLIWDDSKTLSLIHI